MSPEKVKLLIRFCQFAVVAVAAWAIGWRKLPRDDGRRALHYGIVLTAMLLLNQRTWEHHAAVLLIAYVAVWQAVAYGYLGRHVRPYALGLTVLAAMAMWCTNAGLVVSVGRLLGCSGQQAETLADVVDAYGPIFWHLMLLLAAAVLLSVSIRRSCPAYAQARRKLTE